MERGVGFEPTYTGFADLIINNILCCIRLKWRSTRELNPSLLADNQVWYRFTSKPYTRHIILLLYPLSYLRKNGSRSRTRTDNRKITFRLLYVPLFSYQSYQENSHSSYHYHLWSKGEVSVVNSNGLVVCFTISSSLDVYKVESDSKTLGAAFSLFFLLSLPYIYIISEILNFFKFLFVYFNCG